jgi:flagellar motility protein MotE (MotC chaperone)
MSNRLILLLALVSFASVPFAIGVAETKEDQKPAAASKEGDHEAKKEEVAEAPKKKVAGGCLASEEVIQDIENREKKLQEREASIAEREKEVEAQLKAVKEELAKLEGKQNEIQNSKAKELAANEEKVNKLIETLETMSPKAAAGVLGGVDEELAVTALIRLNSVKAGKILSNLKNEKSSRLSELMAYGKLNKGKEKTDGESVERSPANTKQ